MGQIDDVAKAVTMDAKKAGNVVFLVGETKDELGGSHLALHLGLSGGNVPKVDSQQAKLTFQKVHEAIAGGLVRSCHDLSEGGLAVAAAEMAIAGELGMKLDLAGLSTADLSDPEILFSESNTRFLIETTPESADPLQRLLEKAGVAVCRVGTIEASPSLTIHRGATQIMEVGVAEAKAAWQKPLNW